MARTRYKPIDPGKTVRELRKEFRRLQKKEEPGPERAELLANFTKAAHDERQLNMAMHTASQCLEEDPESPELLLQAYLAEDPDDTEERLRGYVDLQDLARYVDDDDISSFVAERIDEESREWVAEGNEQERRHRLRTLASIVDQEFADQLRDELKFL